MRLGILGGSFDPPHVGHLVVAQDAITALSLDRLLIVPAAQQPLKSIMYASPTDRLAMTHRCFDGVPKMVVSPVEIGRGGLSFMVDTVETIRRDFPSADLHLLIGEDVVESLPRWREPERLRSMVRLVVLTRVVGDTDAALSHADLHNESDGSIRYLATRRIDVSSTEIRARVRDGRSIRGHVTDAVAEYIALSGLYLRDPVAVDVSERA